MIIHSIFVCDYLFNLKDAEYAETNEKSIFKILRFLVLRYGHFCTQNWQFSMNFHHNSNNKNGKNLKYDFSFDPALWASFMKLAPFLRGRERGAGVCISLVGKFFFLYPIVWILYSGAILIKLIVYNKTQFSIVPALNFFSKYYFFFSNFFLLFYKTFYPDKTFFFNFLDFFLNKT